MLCFSMCLDGLRIGCRESSAQSRPTQKPTHTPESGNIQTRRKARGSEGQQFDGTCTWWVRGCCNKGLLQQRMVATTEGGYYNKGWLRTLQTERQAWSVVWSACCFNCAQNDRRLNDGDLHSCSLLLSATHSTFLTVLGRHPSTLAVLCYFVQGCWGGCCSVFVCVLTHK